MCEDEDEEVHLALARAGERLPMKSRTHSSWTPWRKEKLIIRAVMYSFYVVLIQSVACHNGTTPPLD